MSRQAIGLEKNRAIPIFSFFSLLCVLSATAVVGAVVGVVDAPPSGDTKGGQSRPSLVVCGGRVVEGDQIPCFSRREEKKRFLLSLLK